jgi:hypothetical protein
MVNAKIHSEIRANVRSAGRCEGENAPLYKKFFEERFYLQLYVKSLYTYFVC